MARFAFVLRFSVLGLIALALVACGGASATNTPAPAASSGSTIPNAFVGAVPGSDAYIAITTTNGTSRSYVCDSKQIATWFDGPVTNNTLDLKAANGDLLKATLAPTGATGTVTIAGKALPFTAAPAKGDAGLFRAEQTVNGTSVIGGWVVGTDGQQRGAVHGRQENRDDITPAPQLVVSQRSANNTWAVTHPTFGALTVTRVVEPDDKRG